MGKHPNYYNKAVQVLVDLKKEFPNQALGQHLSTAFEDYNDLWGVSDKEILHALEKYQFEKDNTYSSASEVEEIYKDGLSIDKPNYLDENDEEDF